MPKLTVSLASFFPVGAWFPWLAVRWAHRLEFDGVQALPVKGWLGLNWWNLPAVSIDSAWEVDEDATVGNIFRAMWQKRKSPSFLNLLFFPTRLWMIQGQLLEIQKRFPKAPHISHQLPIGRNELLEICPELWQTPDQLLSNQEINFVLDLRHCRRKRYQDSRGLKFKLQSTDCLLFELLPWQEWVSKFLRSGKVKMVHIQPIDREELDCFLSGKSTELASMLKDCQNILPPDTIYVVEMTIGFWGILFPWLIGRRLAEFRVRCHEILT